MKDEYCDCGFLMDFIEYGERLDKYDGKLLLVGIYRCPKCEDEYQINVEVDDNGK